MILNYSTDYEKQSTSFPFGDKPAGNGSGFIENLPSP